MVAPSSQFTEGSVFSPTDSRHGREWSPSYRQNIFVLKYLTLKAEHVHKLLPLRKRCPGTQEHHGTAGCKSHKISQDPVPEACLWAQISGVLPWFYPMLKLFKSAGLDAFSRDDRETSDGPGAGRSLRSASAFEEWWNGHYTFTYIYITICDMYDVCACMYLHTLYVWHMY